MKQETKHINRIAKLAYIFAAIVTIFAQMGLVTPLVQVNARTNATVTVDKTTAAPGDIVKVTMTWPSSIEPTSINRLGFKMVGTGLTYQGVVDDGGWKIDPESDFPGMEGDYLIYGNGSTDSVTFQFKVDSSGLPADGVTFKAVQESLVEEDTSRWQTVKPAPAGPSTTDTTTETTPKEDTKTETKTETPTAGTETTPKTTASGLGLDDGLFDSSQGTGISLSILNNGPTTYRVGDMVYLKLQDDMSDADPDVKGQVGFSYTSGFGYLQFDYDSTKAMLAKLGWTIGDATTDGSAKTYTVTKDSGSGSYQIYANGTELHFVWTDVGNMDPHVGVVAMKAMKATPSAVTMTPGYLTGGLGVKKGNGVSLNILQSAIHFEAHTVAPKADGSDWMSSFPLYTVKSGTKTSILYDTTGTNPTEENLQQYRYAAANQLPFSSDNWSSAAQTSADAVENFSLLSTIDKASGAEGQDISDFVPGTAYQMVPDFTVSGNRYGRIDVKNAYSGKDYYMPDGAPTFTLDDASKITLSGDMDGKAKAGQYTLSSDKKTIKVNLYHIKYVQVIDDVTKQPLSGVTVNMTGMKAQTGTNPDANVFGSGEMVPNDYDAKQQGPFYLAAGTQTLTSIDFGANSGYRYAGSFGFDVDDQSDQLKLTADSDASVAADGQTVIIEAHHDTTKDKEINVQKVDANTDKALAGAKFAVKELDGATDAYTDTLTSDDTGLAQGTVAVDSATKTRLLQITETTAPTQYTIGNAAGYYAVWTKGTGFTAVGKADGSNKAPTTTTSADNLASVDADGTLTIKDPPAVYQGGAASSVKFQYVGVDNDGTTTGADGISGAALPALDATIQYADSGVGFTGLGSVIYATDQVSDPTSLVPNGTALASATVQVSGANGQGVVQQLWKQGGLPWNWAAADATTMLNKLGTAITKGVFPTDPMLSYQLNTAAQKARAAKGTEAYDYYSLGSSLFINNDTGKLQAQNTTDVEPKTKVNSAARDNVVTADPATNTVKATLIKVKHVALKDANGNPIQGATVKFTNMATTTPTDAQGEAELIPVDASGKSLADSNFVFPSATQKLVSVTDATGKDITKELGTNPTNFGFIINSAASDQLYGYNPTANIKIADGQTHAKGQYVEMTTTTAATTINIHKGSAVDGSKSLKGAKFKVWASGQTEADAVVTPTATDAQGNTSVTLASPSADGQYYIKETVAPTEAVTASGETKAASYALDTATHQFTWNATSGVTAVASTEKLIAAAPTSDTAHAGMLMFNDMPGGAGGVGTVPNGGNGSNGGNLTILKGDATSTTTPPDGATFTISETTSGQATVIATKTTVSGQITVALGKPTLSDRTFTIQETQAPAGYQLDNTQYQLRITPVGEMTLGMGASDPKTITSTASSNGMVALAGATVKFSDRPLGLTTPSKVLLTKVDQANTAKALAGAHFVGAVKPVRNAFTGVTLDAGSAFDTVTDAQGALSIDLGTATGTGRAISIMETVAPTGYTLNSKQYDIKVNASGTPTGVALFAQDGSETFGTSSSDGVLTIKDGKLQFADVADPNAAAGTINVKKVGSDDLTTGIAGATFEINRITSPAKPDSVEKLTTVAGTETGISKATLSAVTTTQGLFTIKETAAPSGYTLDTKTYYFYWTKAKGVTKVGADANFSSTAATPLSVTTTNGVGTLTFADAKEQNVTIKKVAAGTNQPLAGAQFTLQEVIGSKLDSKTYTSTTTTANGLATIAVGNTGTNYRVFKVVETKAPAGYAKVSANTPLFIGWNPMNQAVELVGGSMTLAGLGGKTYANLTPDPVNGPVIFTDTLEQYTIKTALRTAAKENGQGISGVGVTLSAPSGSTSQSFTADANGKVTIKPQQVADALGLTADQMKGTVDVRLAVNSQGQYTNPVNRIVRFTFSDGQATPGFSVYNGGLDGKLNPSQEALKQNDQMVVDHSTDADVNSGNLTALLRNDTLNAKAIADDNTVGGNLSGVSFTMDFQIGGVTYATKTLTTDANGMIMLPDPNTLLGFTDKFGPNTTGTVTVHQTDQPKTYANNADTDTLIYSTGYGYLSISDPPVTDDATGTMTATHMNGSVMSIQSTLYYFGDSSITYYLTKQINSLNLDSAPETLNFGQPEAHTSAQRMPLLAAGAAAQATFDTRTLPATDPAFGSATSTTEANGQMTAQVTQTGTYADGWRLKLSLGELEAQDQQSTISGGVIDFGQNTGVTRDGTAVTGVQGETQLPMAQSINVLDTGTNSAAGTYTLSWDISKIGLTLPSQVGQIGTNYRAPMTWDVTEAP